MPTFVSIALLFGLALPVAAQPNILVIIADDLGVDRVAVYGEHPEPGNTPTLDKLAQRGLLFRNVWSNPVCSTSRAALLTGRYAFRTGIGHGVVPVQDHELDPDIASLADLLAPTHATGAFGKWHVHSVPGSGVDHPGLMGFEHYAGGLDVFEEFIGDGYTDWVKTVDGTQTPTSAYATSETVDDALAWINDQPGPWFAWVAFHAPHAPFHAPPPELHSFDLPPEVADDIPLHTKAMVEAMDTEIARLFASLGSEVLSDTLVVFVGDNGTDKPAVTPPADPEKAKNTLFEGGINVPLIVAGPGVPQDVECAGLVNTTDLFATLADVAGASLPVPDDSVSMAPYFGDPDQSSLRSFAYADVFQPNGFLPYTRWERAVRDGRFKLIREIDTVTLGEQDALYDLFADPGEELNLLEASPSPGVLQAYERLDSMLDSLYLPWVGLGYGKDGVLGEPKLSASGPLLPGSVMSITLQRAASNELAALLMGADVALLPYKGGVVVPDTSLGLVKLLTTDAAGQITLLDQWPLDAPSGLGLYWQFWIHDPTATWFHSASNALRSWSP
jgi:arylsulfatase A-like enzyme